MPVANKSLPHDTSQQQQHGNPIRLIKKPVSAVVGASWLYPFKVTLTLSVSHLALFLTYICTKKGSHFPPPPFPKKIGNPLLSHPSFPLPSPPNTPDPRLFTFHLRPLQLIHLDLSTSSGLPRHLPRSTGMGSGRPPRAGRRSRDRGAVV